MLKPALSRGEIQCIGATTLDEYRKHIEKDGALERRFQSVNVEPPSPDEAFEILKGLRDRYEAHHRVTYTDEALRQAVDLSTRYINNRFLPDKAIDVMDEAGARVRLKNTVSPPKVHELTAQIDELDRAKERAVSSQEFEKAAKLRDEAYQMRKQREELHNDWRAEQAEKESMGTVDEEMIAETVSKMTGIPLTRLEKAEAERLLQMEDELGTGRHPPGRRDQGDRAVGAPLALGPQGPAPPDGLVPVPRPLGRGQDLPLQAARQVHVRRRRTPSSPWT